MTLKAAVLTTEVTEDTEKIFLPRKTSRKAGTYTPMKSILLAQSHKGTKIFIEFDHL